MATTTADARERHRISNIFATGRPTNVPVKRIFAPGKRMQAAPTSAVSPVQEPNTTQDSLFDGSLPSSWTFSQDTQTVSREAYEENQRLRAEEKAEQERELEPSPSPAPPPPPPPQPKPLPSSRRSHQNPSSTLSQQYMQRALKSNEKRDLQDPDYQEQDDITTPKRQYVTRSRTSANANVSFNDEHEHRHTPPSPSSRMEEEEESIDEDSSSGPDEIPAIYQDVPTSSAQRRVVVVKSKPPRKSPPSKKSNDERRRTKKQTSRLSPVPQRPTQTEEENFLGLGMEIDYYHQSPDSDSERRFTTTTPRRVPQTTIPSHTTRPDVSSRSDEELVRDLRAARAGLERAEARTRKAMAAEREALDRKEKIWAEMEKRFACASPKRGMM
ncbi:uncharacterized protein MYCFIDRAFT_210685 [Pseudocercospora fijiensis CIRAD86]|uniref:Uncharacterized protein n=1 Tax=Pseudocercospora fijiensis (strain CIRAD86) TaxID=383855 RepID=M3BCS8_PSEFD|nr:uncharacterized protein MYCFIDRAFT_210685 [Pseudocercospora fijiensis CIRAD86]EME87082.1 hypothetical protein MYCFIDRAFT_210685 [Pseudocercospora fijiensis CIRAD86]